MTEIAVRQDQNVNLIHNAARDLADASKIAEVLVRTSFAPAHFRGKPEEGAVAILYGAGIGMDPMAAIQNIYVISGKPALYARSMVAVVLSHGHQIWTEEAGPTKVVVCGQRKGSDKVERSEWTYDRARKAGYTSNKKYETEPEAMLFARASGDVARRVAPDALLGMAYNVEELEVATSGPDGVPSITSAAAPTTAADRLRGAIGAVANEPEPEKPAQEPVKATAERVDQPTRGTISDRQLTALNAALRNDMGFTERGDAFAWLSSELGREVTSTSELSKSEGSRMIDKIKTETTSTPAAPSEPLPDEPPIEGEIEWPEVAPAGAR